MPVVLNSFKAPSVVLYQLNAVLVCLENYKSVHSNVDLLR